jgi:uncharacterized protein YjbI with pentapeptide repeats
VPRFFQAGCQARFCQAEFCQAEFCQAEFCQAEFCQAEFCQADLGSQPGSLRANTGPAHREWAGRDSGCRVGN